MKRSEISLDTGQNMRLASRGWSPLLYAIGWW